MFEIRIINYRNEEMHFEVNGVEASFNMYENLIDTLYGMATIDLIDRNTGEVICTNYDGE